MKTNGKILITLLILGYAGNAEALLGNCPYGKVEMVCATCSQELQEQNINRLEKAFDSLATAPEFANAQKFKDEGQRIKGMNRFEDKFAAIRAITGTEADESLGALIAGKDIAQFEAIAARNLELTSVQTAMLLESIRKAMIPAKKD